MDIRQLRYFIAAAEEGHLGRAAERLHLSQPALTRQIQLMESAVGAELFVRTPRGMALTPIGETMLTDARDIVRTMQQAIDRAQRAARGELGSIDIGVFGTACFDYVPRLLTHLRRERPNVGFALHYMPPERLVAALRRGQLLVMFERLWIEEPDIATIVAAREPAVVALHEDHPLAQQTAVEASSLASEPLIIGRHSTHRQGSLKLCRDHGFEPKVLRESDNMTVSVMLVAAGMGSCIVPLSVANLHVPGVVYRPLLSHMDVSMKVYGYYLMDERSPLLRVALEAIAALSTLARATPGAAVPDSDLVS